MSGFNVSEPARTGYALARIRRRLLAASVLAVAVALLSVYPVRADPPWGTNERVDDAPGSTSARFPSTAVDSSGNAYAVWVDERNGDRDIYFSYRPAGGSWQANEQVNDVPGLDEGPPSIAVDSAGNAYVVWEDSRNGDRDIYFSYRPAGGSWQANQRVDDAPGSTHAYMPDIAVDSSGNAYALWADQRSGSHDIYFIYFSYRPAGGSWQANQRVDDASGAATGLYRSIAVDSSGNAYATWVDERNGNWDIYFSYRPAGGSWQANQRVDDAPGPAVAWSPSIAVDSPGNAYAVWNDSRNVNTDVYFSYRPAGGSWQADQRVDDASSTTTVLYRSIAVDSSGNAYAVWIDERSGNWDTYFSYRPAGGSWQANGRVDDAPGATDTYSPAVAVDPAGNAYAVWEDYRNGNEDIYYSDTLFAPGDCNGDHLVDAGDGSAIALEIFDGDGTNPASASGGTFAGTPGCDANEDGVIDAGDGACIPLLILNGPGACDN